MDNKSLLASLVADRDRYLLETPRIPPPEAIVVSGDLIEGATIGAKDWETSIKNQHSVAYSFLTDLSDHFLNGDKSRIVLIPGNHDVCWNTSYRAMSAVEKNQYPTDVLASIIKPGSTYRWSWSEQKLFRITNEIVYNQRMDQYWEFINCFYDGVDLPFPIDRARGFQLFELCQGRILVAAFDSIDGNDCFSYAGSFARGAVGKCAIELRDANHDYDLKIASWHHSIQGPPLRSDYMNASQVQEMIGHGFQMGLHGHQHMAGALAQYIHLDEKHTMAVVSAGSLCAGSNQLPRGVNRQYNLIVVEDDFLRARVHVREMGDGEQFTRKRTGAFLEGFVDVSWQPQTNMMGVARDAQERNVRRAVENAELALNTGKPSEAIMALRGVDIGSQPHARKLKICALNADGNWSDLISTIGQPVSVEERVLLISTLINTDKLEEAQSRLDEESEIDPTTQRDLHERLEARRMMRRS